jgi:hypothetical protein
MGDRASYRQLFFDLLAYSKLSRKNQKSLHTRYRHEIWTLVGCPSEARAEAIEGIIMQRFFGDSRHNIRRSRGYTDTPFPTQPTIDAVGNVIDTPELLESILSHLPVHTLLPSTRVSRTFRNVTHNSPTLLRNLFLLPTKERSEAMTGASNKEPDSNQRGRTYDEYKVATLCPLLSLTRQDLTFDKRLEFADCETAVIKPSTTWADSFTHMYLTNPPCTQVEVDFVSTGSNFASSGYTNTSTEYTISGTRIIQMGTVVTFDAIIEATYTIGNVYIHVRGREGIRMHTRTNTTLHAEVKAWHQHNFGRMCLSGDTRIYLFGVVFWTDADKAAADKVERQLKMQSEQKETFQKVLIELWTRGSGGLKEERGTSVEN